MGESFILKIEQTQKKKNRTNSLMSLEVTGSSLVWTWVFRLRIDIKIVKDEQNKPLNF